MTRLVFVGSCKISMNFCTSVTVQNDSYIDCQAQLLFLCYLRSVPALVAHLCSYTCTNGTIYWRSAGAVQKLWRNQLHKESSLVGKGDCCFLAIFKLSGASYHHRLL